MILHHDFPNMCICIYVRTYLHFSLAMCIPRLDERHARSSFPPATQRNTTRVCDHFSLPYIGRFSYYLPILNRIELPFLDDFIPGQIHIIRKLSRHIPLLSY